MPAKKRTLTAVTNNKKRKENLGARARGAAMQQMIESYPERWDELLTAEREKLGLSADTGRVTRLQKFIQKMKAAGVEDSDIQAALEEAGFTKDGRKSRAVKVAAEEE